MTSLKTDRLLESTADQLRGALINAAAAVLWPLLTCGCSTPQPQPARPSCERLFSDCMAQVNDLERCLFGKLNCEQSLQ